MRNVPAHWVTRTRYLRMRALPWGTILGYHHYVCTATLADNFYLDFSLSLLHSGLGLEQEKSLVSFCVRKYFFLPMKEMAILLHLKGYTS